MAPIVIGTGQLNWQTIERHSDRYGAVHLNRDHQPQQVDTSHAGERGRLVAVFPDGHDTDPSIPDGHVVELGSGTLFVEGDTEVGVKPDDGRAEHWLDGKALTLCDGQLVRLELRRHADLIADLRRQLPELPHRWQRHALNLLLDYDGGVWFTDSRFLASVVDDATDFRPARVDFAKLGRVLAPARNAQAWTYRHGATGGRVLWLACELAVGRLGDVVQSIDDGSDADADELIRTLFARLLPRHD
jgi:hypothetical protein